MNDFLPVKLLTETARLPTRGTDRAIGLDLYADLPGGPMRLAVGSQICVPTNVAVAIPDGHYGRVAPRSGLAFKTSVAVMAGVIDGDFRDGIAVILIRHLKDNDLNEFNPDNDLIINHGDRIAQLILERASILEPRQVDELDETARGGGKFGSTGS